MFCTKCGQQLPSDANFCLKCGLPQKPEVGTSPPSMESERVIIRVHDKRGGEIAKVTNKRLSWNRDRKGGKGEVVLWQITDCWVSDAFMAKKEVVVKRSQDGHWEDYVHIECATREDAERVARAILDAKASL